MNHNDHDNEEAVKTAQKYLEASMYKDQLPTAGLFWAQLVDREKVLKALTSPRLGDSLLRPDGSPWMLALACSAPKLNWDDLAQIPALPLGSWLKTDPWDDRVQQSNAKLYVPLNPRDKMPLEVTPVYYKLQRFSVSNNPLAPAKDTPADRPATGEPNSSPAPIATPGQGTTSPALDNRRPAILRRKSDCALRNRERSGQSAETSTEPCWESSWTRDLGVDHEPLPERLEPGSKIVALCAERTANSVIASGPEDDSTVLTITRVSTAEKSLVELTPVISPSVL
jgi:hypothetical protein